MSYRQPSGMIRVQLPTGKSALVDSNWWYDATDDELKRFYEKDHGADFDPLSTPIPHADSEIPEFE